MSLIITNPAYEAAYQDLIALVQRHADQMTALEILAIASNMVGKLIAMQDHRTVSADDAMEIVVANIETGNQQVAEHMMNETAGRA